MAFPEQGWRLGHRPGLDGLRGIAILLVLAGHVMPDAFVNGGSVGVTVFFALSGFLITSLLIEEQRGTGTFSPRRFYERRARRLLPALAVYLACWIAFSIFAVGPYRVAPGEVLAAMFYFMNWVLAAGIPVSHPMAITWSLSVEEQFYLLWPLTFIFARRWPRAPWVAAALGIVVAVGLRIVSWSGPSSGGSIYYRTDTRMDSILIGCLLALLVYLVGPPNRVRVLAPMCLAAIAVLLAWHVPYAKYVVVPGVVALATCGLILATITGHLRWLEWTPLRWFGKRSYALYLWHYPLVVMAWPGIGVLPMWLAIVLALTAAELSWWLVERPFRRPSAKPGQARAKPSPEGVEPPVVA
jgi:peptidoglycan/LPS O-acetylase OafA/YrhL